MSVYKYHTSTLQAMNKGEVFTYVICFVLLVILLTGVGVGIYEWRSYLAWLDSRVLTVQKKCEEYMKYACKDLILNSHILLPITSRNEALEGMHPHMAYVKIFSELAAFTACSGTLISEYFIMTSAHCVHNVKTHQILVKLGSVSSRNDSTGAWFQIDRIHIHEKYQQVSILHDIALLRLATKVELDKRIRPICLNWEDIDEDYKNVILAAGWGLDESDGIAPENLQILITYQDPTTMLECHREEWDRNYYKFMFCAGHPATRRSTCQIDPGGSLQLLQRSECANTYEQIGIASSNLELNCTNSPDTLIVVYTKVRPYIPWIVGIVWPEE